MNSNSPLFQILEALSRAIALNEKTHSYFHELLKSYSAEVQQLMDCATCKYNFDRTANGRQALHRLRERLAGELKQDVLPNEISSLVSSQPSSLDYGLIEALIGENPNRMTLQLNEFDLQEWKLSLLTQVNEAKNLNLSEYAKGRDEFIFNLIAMLHLAQEDQVGGFRQDEKRDVWVWVT